MIAMGILDKVRAAKEKLAATQRDRKRLRGPAEFTFAIADSIHLLNDQAWDQAAAHAGVFLSRQYLAALEPVLPANMSARYALIYDRIDAHNSRPIAAVYMQIIDLVLAEARAGAKIAGSGKWLEPISHRVAGNARQRVLVCGNFLTYGLHGVAFAPDVDAKAVWHGVAEVLYRVRQSEKLVGKTHFMLIKDLHAPFTADAKYLEKLSYRYVETEPNMVLTLDPAWKTYEDYLASLASKYRANIRNGVLKPIEEAGCVVERLADLAPVQSEIHALYEAVQQNANFRPYLLQPEYFPALRRAMGNRFRCSVLRREGRMLGFLMTVADGDTAIAYHIGFDREAARTLPVYLRLLHAGIADALAMGCKRVSFGRTALEPKAALGAKPQTFGVLVRHRQPVLNKLIKRLLLGIDHEVAPERSPFKKPA